MAGISFSGITPALHRRHAAAAPRRDRADVGHRRPLHRHGLPGRDPQLAASRARGSRSGWRTPSPRPTGGQPYARALVEAGDGHCRAQPAAAPADPGRDRAQRAQPAPRAVAVRRPLARALDGARSRSRRSSSAVPGRADRRPLRREPRPPRATTRASGSRSRTASTSTRSARARSRAGSSSSSSTSPTRSRRSRTPSVGLGGELYRFLADAPAAPVEQSRFAGRHRRRRRARGVRAGPARAAADGQRRRPGRARLDRRVVGARLRRLADRARPSPTAFFLGAGGALTPGGARARAPVDYLADPAARPATTLPGDGDADAWKAQPPYDWRPLADGKGVGFATAPLDAGRRHRRRRPARPADLGLGGRHRPAGDAQRDPARRRGDLRPERLAARLAPQAGDAPRSRARRRSRAGRDASRARSCRSSRSRTPSAPARASASPSQAPGGDRPRWRFDSRRRRLDARDTSTSARPQAGRCPSCPASTARRRRCRRRPRCAASRAAPTCPAANGG